jgi:four helix bundle protein
MGNRQWAMGNGAKRRDPEGGAISSHRDLDVWQVTMDLAVACYEMTRSFTRDKLFGMTSQIRRAAASIPANIAEGYGRDNCGDYVHHLRIAQGSLKELETHLELAIRVGLAKHDYVEPILATADRAGRMLRALYRALQRT